MSFRKNNIKKIESDVNISTRKNQLDDIKDDNQETRIQILEKITNSLVNTAIIDDLISRITALEIKVNANELKVNTALHN
jgi:hypothetical protein